MSAMSLLSLLELGLLCALGVTLYHHYVCRRRQAKLCLILACACSALLAVGGIYAETGKSSRRLRVTRERALAVQQAACRRLGRWVATQWPGARVLIIVPTLSSDRPPEPCDTAPSLTQAVAQLLPSPVSPSMAHSAHLIAGLQEGWTAQVQLVAVQPVPTFVDDVCTGTTMALLPGSGTEAQTRAFITEVYDRILAAHPTCDVVVDLQGMTLLVTGPVATDSTAASVAANRPAAVLGWTSPIDLVAAALIERTLAGALVIDQARPMPVVPSGETLVSYRLLSPETCRAYLAELTALGCNPPIPPLAERPALAEATP